MLKIILNLRKVVAIAICLAAIMLPGCGKDDAANEVTGIVLDTMTLKLPIGEEYILKATITPGNADDKTVAWSSSDYAIATVTNGGKVIAISKGTVSIMAMANSKFAACLVTVPDPLVYDKGVVINGVKWSSRNVDNPGFFTANPEDRGLMFQWNRKAGWPAAGPMNATGSATGTVWEKVNDPSPEGWRVPTLDELKRLLEADKVKSEWVTINGIDGTKFTERASGNFIFLSGGGMINGTHNNGQKGGFYRSNITSNMYCGSSSLATGDLGGHYGMSLRPVAE